MGYVFRQEGRGWYRCLGWALHVRRLWVVAAAGAGLALALLAGTGAAQAADQVHIVRPGENLARIAQQYNLSLAQLSAYNGISNPDIVWVGQQIAIPYDAKTVLAAPPANVQQLPGDGGYYVVAPGDMLARIARAHGMTLADLMRINGMSNADHILVGQKLRLTARVDPPGTTAKAEPVLADAIYVVRDGDTLAQIAQGYGMTLNDIMLLNGLPNPNFVWTGQRLRVKQAPSPAQAMAAAGAPANGKRVIEINLSDQTLTAWQGGVAVLRTHVSSGKASTPTVPGQFSVYHKLDSQRMTGPGYDLPGVPWVMYFYKNYAIHGAYWHNSFGVPISHGCVNMTVEDARALYEWAAVGTEVVVNP
jgi:LysM repeat protein